MLRKVNRILPKINSQRQVQEREESFRSGQSGVNDRCRGILCGEGGDYQSVDVFAECHLLILGGDEWEESRKRVFPKGSLTEANASVRENPQIGKDLRSVENVKSHAVPKEGLEPSHGVKPYWILSPARLPIPPLRLLNTDNICKNVTLGNYEIG